MTRAVELEFGLEEMRQRGGRVLLAAPPGTPGVELSLVTTDHAALDPFAGIQSFYLIGSYPTRRMTAPTPRGRA